MSEPRLFDAGPLADPEERQVIFATLDSFRQYRRNSHYNVTHRRRQNLYALPEHQWKVLAAPPFNLLETLNKIDDALDCNADIADAILDLGLSALQLPAEPERGSPYYWHGSAKPDDLAKAHSTVRQFYRDWSKEGFAAEVEPLLKLILEDLQTTSLRPKHDSTAPSLLVPGAGLGRLLFSLALEGYNAEGNEISYHQLLASNFILNATAQAQQFKLYPFASTFTNHTTRGHQLKETLIPDIHPSTAMLERKENPGRYSAGPGHMNMIAGDFLTSYGDPDSRDSFDGAITVYFIDTAPNLIRYIETIRDCMKDGGIWINIGPLLWHFDDRAIGSERDDKSKDTSGIPDQTCLPSSRGATNSDLGIGEPGSFELADNEVLALLEIKGFKILKHDYVSTQHGGYIQDPESMVQNRYVCSHWVAQKLLSSNAL